ncbi:MAG TPA: hypothetical protein VNR66_09210 [Solirubrobacteraceae bacterium]|nr:hypothetical protein [Solirubrobacteraceae bacterium]
MDSLFRMVCAPAALTGAPDGWAAETLRDGEMALLVDGGGLEAINAAAHALELVAVSIVRSEDSDAEQAETVIAFAGSLPLVWVGSGFSERVRTWAHDRLPMTLLVEVDGPLPGPERSRIERFLALLGRQTE